MKKLLLTILITALFVCAFSITASAATLSNEVTITCSDFLQRNSRPIEGASQIGSNNGWHTTYDYCVKRYGAYGNITSFRITNWSINSTYLQVYVISRSENKFYRYAMSSSDVGRTISVPSSCGLYVAQYGATSGSISIELVGNDDNITYVDVPINYYDNNNNLIQAKTFNWVLMSCEPFYRSLPSEYIDIAGYATPYIYGDQLYISNTDNIPTASISGYIRTAVNYTVNYVDGSGNVLKTATVESAAIGETIELTADNIYGYSCAENAQSITINEDSSLNTVTFVYAPVSCNLTVMYKDGNGNEISPSVTTSHLFGDTVNLTAPVVEGYSVLNNSYDYEIVSVGNNAYTFVYDVAQYPYTVNYEDSQGNVLSTPLAGRALYNTTVIENALTIEGYSPNLSSCSIFIGSGNNTYTFVYSANSYSYTVKYVNSDNEVLSTSYTANAEYGTFVNIEAPVITGYSPNVSNYSLYIGSGTNEYTFIYGLNSYDYTVRYVDSDNVELIVPTVGTAFWGETVTANAVGIVGYTPAFETSSIIIGSAVNEIVFSYVATAPIIPDEPEPPDNPDKPTDTGEFGTGENKIADLNAIQFIRLWFIGVWEFLKGVEIPVLKVTAAAFLIALFLIGLVINLVGYIIGVQFGTIDLPSTAKTFNQRGGNNGRYKISDKRKKDRF